MNSLLLSSYSFFVAERSNLNILLKLYSVFGFQKSNTNAAYLQDTCSKESKALYRNVARMIASAETLYSTSLEQIQLIEDNLFKDLCLGKFVIPGLKNVLVSITDDNDYVCSTAEVSYSIYTRIFNRIASNLFTTDRSISKTCTLNDDTTLIDKDVFKAISQNMITANLPSIEDDEEYLDLICEYVHSADHSINVLFTKLLAQNTLNKKPLLDTYITPIGCIDISKFVNQDLSYNFEELIMQVHRAVYYLDLMCDAMQYSSVYLENYSRPIGLSIAGIDILANKLKQKVLVNTLDEPFAILLHDIAKYISTEALLSSINIVDKMGKSNVIFKSDLDSIALQNILADMKCGPCEYYSYAMDQLNEGNLRNSQRLIIQNTDLFSVENTSSLNQDDIIRTLSIFTRYIDGPVHQTFKLNEADDCKKILRSCYQNNISHVSIHKESCSCDCHCNNNRLLEDILKDAKIEELVKVLRDNKHIFNKLFASFVSSGRSAQIIREDSNDDINPSVSTGSFIKVILPNTQINFNGKFDHMDRLKELFVICNDKNCNEDLDVLAKIVSLALQNSKDYSDTCHQLLWIFKSNSDSINIKEFEYTSVHTNASTIIHNLYELFSIVLPDLEYVYLLQKYGTAEEANSKMQFIL